MFKFPGQQLEKEWGARAGSSFGLWASLISASSSCACTFCPISSISHTALPAPSLPSDRQAINPCEGCEDLLEEGTGDLQRRAVKGGQLHAGMGKTWAGWRVARDQQGPDDSQQIQPGLSLMEGAQGDVRVAPRYGRGKCRGGGNDLFSAGQEKSKKKVDEENLLIVGVLKLTCFQA